MSDTLQQMDAREAFPNEMGMDSVEAASLKAMLAGLNAVEEALNPPPEKRTGLGATRQELSMDTPMG